MSVLYPCDTQLPPKRAMPPPPALRASGERGGGSACVIAENGNGAAREFFAAERLRRQDGQSIPSLRLAAQGMVTACYNKIG